MVGEAGQFAASLLAVLALVGLTWLLGFRQQARLASVDEARELMRLAPGGFEPVELAVDAQGCGAIGRDAGGRLLVLAPHGNRFVAWEVAANGSLHRDGSRLEVGFDNRRLAIDLGAAAADWIAADSSVS